MKPQNALALLTTTLLLLTASCSSAHKSAALTQKDKALSYPLAPTDREILSHRVAAIQKGMTVKESLATLQPMHGFPPPNYDTPNTNSFTQDLGLGWSLRLNFADAADGGGFLSAILSPPFHQLAD